ncbi:MAG: glycosyl transferase [Marinomonas sp.]|nr:glycosyl transferase [Marinomonas sp.]
MLKRKIYFISFSFSKGGAAIAAKKYSRLLSMLSLGLDINEVSQDEATGYAFLKRIFSYFLVFFQYDSNPIKHSLNLFTYTPVINAFDDHSEAVFHFHWINNDTLSVFDFDKIPAGSILTLHDEWLYCGAEHYYKVDDEIIDFKESYRFFKKGVYGINWNYIIWRIKKYKLSRRQDLIYTVPSNWILKRAKSSMILKSSDVRLLPNPIDTDVFKPLSEREKSDIRLKYSIENDDFIFCFGAIDGRKNHIKGVHLLDEALKVLSDGLPESSRKKVKLIDFGGDHGEGVIHGFKNISVGHISNPKDLASLYSIADCVVVPSMVESFGQVAAEALSCCTPVICFDTSGLKDIVTHAETGLVAEPFSPKSLAKCMLEMIEMSSEERRIMGELGRKHVESSFSYSVVAEQYVKIIQDAESIKENIEK